MSEFYQEMQGIATELLTEYDQGGIVAIAPISETPDASRPWDVTDAEPVVYPVVGVARTVEDKYVDGTRVKGREVQITFAVPTNFVPDMNYRFRIGSSTRDRAPIMMKRIPEAGTAVSYVFVLAD